MVVEAAVTIPAVGETPGVAEVNTKKLLVTRTLLASFFASNYPQAEKASN